MPYVDPEIIAEVKRVDLLTYLQEREPDELVRISPGVYCTKEHDSLKISNGKWVWWSRGLGGRSALDFLVKVRDMAFLDAVEHLRADRPAVARASPPAHAAPPASAPRPAFRLPRRCADDDAMRYLESRGISRSLLKGLVDAGDVYGTMRGGVACAVFVGRDRTGVPRYAALRSCEGGFKGEAPRSDKRFAFSLQSVRNNGVLHVFESAIDALSYATILEHEGKQTASLGMLSLGGVSVPHARNGAPKLPLALAQHLDDRPYIASLALHLDNDEAGRRAAREIARAAASRGVAASMEPPPEGKDVNEFLLARRSRGRAPDRGR